MFSTVRKAEMPSERTASPATARAGVVRFAASGSSFASRHVAHCIVARADAARHERARIAVDTWTRSDDAADMHGAAVEWAVSVMQCPGDRLADRIVAEDSNEALALGRTTHDTDLDGVGQVEVGQAQHLPRPLCIAVLDAQSGVMPRQSQRDTAVVRR